MPRFPRFRSWSLASLAFAAMLPACVSDPSAFRTDAVDALHPDAVTEVSIEIGTAVTLTLPGNAGTGYDWVLADGLPEFLRQRGQSRFVAKEASRVGSQGDTRFIIEAVGPGEASVRFHYLPGWNQNARPVRWAEAAVTAKTKGG